MMNRVLRCAGLALALAGCAGPMRPGAGPTVSSLPDDPGKRDRVLQSAEVPSESRRSGSEAEPETVAATFAAFLGVFFSAGANAFVGLAVPIDENRLVAPGREATPRPRAGQVEPQPE